MMKLWIALFLTLGIQINSVAGTYIEDDAIKMAAVLQSEDLKLWAEDQPSGKWFVSKIEKKLSITADTAKYFYVTMESNVGKGNSRCLLSARVDNSSGAIWISQEKCE